MTYYLGVFATQAGTSTICFPWKTGGGTITNSMGPVTLENFSENSKGFSADMPAGPGKHHFEAVYTNGGLHVVGTVIMEGNPVGTYEADMEKADSDHLPADPEGPSDPPDGPGPGGPGMDHH